MARKAELSYPERMALLEACAAFERATRRFKAAPAGHSARSRVAAAVPRHDAIQFDLDGKTFSVPVFVQLGSTVAGVVLARHRQGTRGGSSPERTVMLVFPYLTRARAEQLVEQNVPFLDMAGNVYLDEPEGTVLITGRPKPTVALPTQSARATTPKGLKVMFAIATRPGIVAQAYRTIAAAAGVSLNTVGLAMDDLMTRGLVAESRNGERLIPDWKRFVDEWVSHYPSRLRNKLGARRFASASPDWWRRFDFAKFGMQLGGEAGAERLTDQLKAISATIYARDSLSTEFMLQARLTPSAHGDVEILGAFWPDASVEEQESASSGLVHPLLVYADLVATGDSRNLSIAEQIYDERLAALQS